MRIKKTRKIYKTNSEWEPELEVTEKKTPDINGLEERKI